MSDLFEKIVGARGTIENIVSKIPGFKGYIEKEDRREADSMLRNWLSSRVQALARKLSQVEKQMITGATLQYLDDTKSISTKIRTLADSIKTAGRGYAGLFDAIKIKEEELAQLYAFDAAMTDYVDKLDAGIDALQAAVDSGEGLPQAIRALEALAVEANEAYREREHLFSRVGGESV